MKRSDLLRALFLLVLTSVVVLAIDEHPSVISGAPETSAKKLAEQLGRGKKVLVIDVRSAQEYAQGHIPGAINVPLEELTARIAEMEIPKDTTVVTVCDHGGRSSRAAIELQKLGYKTPSFCRLEAWRKAGFKIKTGSEKPRPTSRVYKFTCHHYCQSDKQTPDLEQHCECACGEPYHECMKGV